MANPLSPPNMEYINSSSLQAQHPTICGPAAAASADRQNTDLISLGPPDPAKHQQVLLPPPRNPGVVEAEVEAAAVPAGDDLDDVIDGDADEDPSADDAGVEAQVVVAPAGPDALGVAAGLPVVAEAKLEPERVELHSDLDVDRSVRHGCTMAVVSFLVVYMSELRPMGALVLLALDEIESSVF
ncbi:hypothetical protein BKA67DRAFT_534289 [Truncatella angustata]|uniref:Uncharacterized protein n=1 Tax=Truncatella angustata TaxID=152316 RepID=A0A9P8ZZU1_9PEZI|nr:uncharacterized protein BKA67DRAFT_534289 [Truncatella angustata]KAH6655359.1 hypothetical protein BKA67DRAFT_534289 [Truncatella angustata]